MRKLVELNDDDWFDKYKPMANHIDPDMVWPLLIVYTTTSARFLMILTLTMRW